MSDLATMRDTVRASRAAVARIREAIERTERELALERRQRADAERRGQLAAEIGDAETVAVARRFAGRHAERVRVLERKLEVQQEERALLERELAEMTEQLAAAEQRAGAAGASGLEGAAEPPETAESEEEERLRARLDRAYRERVAEAQLEALKRKLGQRKGP